MNETKRQHPNCVSTEIGEFIQKKDIFLPSSTVESRQQRRHRELKKEKQEKKVFMRSESVIALKNYRKGIY